MVEVEVKDAMAKTPASSKPHRQGCKNEGEIQAKPEEPKEKGEIEGKLFSCSVLLN